MQGKIEKRKFNEIDLNDIFFDSLRRDYAGFDDWFNLKAAEEREAYILRNSDKKISGFLALKVETNTETEVTALLPAGPLLKISTFKIDAHGTVLGQRFLSLVFSKWISEKISTIYVTLFPKQEGLIDLFEKFGFELVGRKTNGESVYVKNGCDKDDIYKDFPRFHTDSREKYLISIHPEYHTKMFPDSRLVTEQNLPVEDLSFTNTIEKVYLTKMSQVRDAKPGDLLVIYRTKPDSNAPAEYTSVATSICTVAENRSIDSFSSKEDFIRYCGKGSVFSEGEMESFWAKKKYPYIIKMLYNAPLKKRIVRRDLFEKVGIPRTSGGQNTYFGFVSLTDSMFDKIMEEGQVNESFIID